MKYRPEIDGLRAIAVISVLIYHAKFVIGESVLLSGGFLGVDIFFVISGFLITKIIAQDIRQERFSYADFYQRRARRILPALFAVMLASAPFAWAWILPEQLLEYAHSIFGALFFSSNFVFFLEDSYTAAPSALKPFLHTWSLGIEEQFYIVLPFAMIFLLKRLNARTTLWILIGAAALSLLIAQILSSRWTDANFFLLPSRAWELLAGSIVAFLTLDHQEVIAKIRFKGHLCFIALVCLVASLFIFNEATPHPSSLTAVPVLACALLICFSQEPNYVSRLLSNSVFVKIGLVSYSLYLWHFPLFAFYRLQFGEPTVATKFVLLAASLSIAYLSYRWIEKPFRNKHRIGLRPLIAAMTIGTIAISIFQATIIYNEGFSNRLGDVESYISNSQPIMYQNGAEPNTATNPIVALGDSHARIFSHPLKQLADAQGRPFLQIARDGCPMVKDVDLYQDGKRVSDCLSSYTPRLEAIRHFNNGIYFYSGRFALYQEGKRFAQEPGYSVLLSDQGRQASPEKLRSLILETISTLLAENIKLVLVYPIPEMGFDAPKIFVDNFKSVNPLQLKQTLKINPLAIEKSAFLQRTQAITAAFDSLPEHSNLIRLKPSDLLCDATKCYANDQESLFYYDDNHLSPATAQKLIDSIIPELTKRGWIN